MDITKTIESIDPILFGFVIAAVFVCFCFIAAYYTEKHRPKIVDAQYDDRKKIITITFSNSIQNQYILSNEKWYRLPYFSHVDSEHFDELNKIKMYCETFGNPYPTSHIK